MTEQEEMTAFAKALIVEPDPFKAALSLYPADTNRALWIAFNWPRSPAFLELKHRVSHDKSVQLGPSQNDFDSWLWRVMTGEVFAEKEQIDAANTLAKSRGWVKKETTTNVNATLNNKVMIIRDLGSDDQWERDVEKQQRELLNANAIKH